MESVLLDHGAVEVSALDVYGDIFRLGYGFLQQENEPPGAFKANPIILGEKNGRIRRRILFEDTFEEILAEFQDYDWAILNGLTYWGRENTSANQSKMCAMIFDVDGVTPASLDNLIHAAKVSDVYPLPQYVILSGHGVHLYYVFEEPLDLYPGAKTQLKNLKYALTDKLWNRYTSEEEKVQHQGINQGFRVIGGRVKEGSGRVRAFRLNAHPTNVEQLSEYVPDEAKVEQLSFYPEAKMSLEEARRLYPGWYERRVIGKAPRGRWYVKRDLYDWWIRQIKSGAAPGHRYFCVMCLAIYGAKCGIDFEEVERDAFSLIPQLDALDHSRPFTEADVRSALECFDERYVTFPRKDISKLSGIVLPANKRNGRKQAQHVKMMSMIRDMDDPEGAWRNKAGAPSKESLIKAYADEHPEANHSEIARALGVSRTTVSKWLK